jgi:hypothetical protein
MARVSQRGGEAQLLGVWWLEQLCSFTSGKKLEYRLYSSPHIGEGFWKEIQDLCRCCPHNPFICSLLNYRVACSDRGMMRHRKGFRWLPSASYQKTN